MKTMKVLFIFLGIWTISQAVPEEVEVRFRSAGENNEHLPDYLEVILEPASKKRAVDLPTRLRLIRNYKINKINFYVDGIESPMDHKYVRFYQDRDNGAVIKANIENVEDRKVRTIVGSFIHAGKGYEIEPTELTNEKQGKRSLKEVDGHVHVIREIVREISEDHHLVVPPIELPDKDPENHNNSTRKLRQVTTTVDHYDVEQYWVSDPQFYIEWQKDYSADLQKVQEFFGHTANGVDLAYGYIANMNKGITISSWVLSVNIMTEGTLSITETAKTGAVNPNNNRDSVNEDIVLENMVTYKNEQEWTFDKPDHFMFFTGYDLSGSTVGYAPLKGICTASWGISAVEFSGYRTWPICAHELGHNIGMNHDGSNGCPAEDNIMSPSVVMLLHAQDIAEAYKFSSCSVEQAKSCLQGSDSHLYPRKCLKKTVCNNGWTVDTSVLPGTYISLDEQCQDLFDDSPGQCSSNFGYDICQVLWCSKGGSSCSAKQEALQGSPCGAGKWCIKGSCVSTSTNPPSLSKPCTAGTGVSAPPASCTDSHNSCPVVGNYAGLNCPNSYWKNNCCKTCTEMGF